MAQSKKKNYWYVIVFTSEGPKYVTSTEYHTAKWDMLETPLELGKYWAEDITKGLLLNGYNAAAVCMPIELSHQPYMYETGKFEWSNNKEDDENGK